MNTDNLIRMANRIADFFKAMPNREQALRDAADHLQKFWEPRMRKDLLDYIQTTKEHELDPFMIEAISKHPMS